jgi:hypothetical protein
VTGRATHGHTRGRTTTPEFRTWCAMLQRCFYKNNQKYLRYGAKGITVCARWKESFEEFLKDMGPRPEGHTLDRIDGKGNYEPSNCRWATVQEQNKNRDHTNLGWRRYRDRCSRGHLYTIENLAIRPDGSRRCRECTRITKRERESRGAAT